MRRFPVLVLMLVAMLWQSVALARLGSTVNPLIDQDHAALHWQEEAHHHHDDGSYLQDDSPESTQHVVNDHLSTTAALLSDSTQTFAPLGAAVRRGLHGSTVPAPDLEGLLRPPRPRS
jgi:hypothetical protein